MSCRSPPKPRQTRTHRCPEPSLWAAAHPGSLRWGGLLQVTFTCHRAAAAPEMRHSRASRPDSCSRLLTPSPMRTWVKPTSFRNSSCMNSVKDPELAVLRQTWGRGGWGGGWGGWGGGGGGRGAGGGTGWASGRATWRGLRGVAHGGRRHRCGQVGHPKAAPPHPEQRGDDVHGAVALVAQRLHVGVGGLELAGRAAPQDLAHQRGVGLVAHLRRGVDRRASAGGVRGWAGGRSAEGQGSHGGAGHRTARLAAIRRPLRPVSKGASVDPRPTPSRPPTRNTLSAVMSPKPVNVACRLLSAWVGGGEGGGGELERGRRAFGIRVRRQQRAPRRQPPKSRSPDEAPKALPPWATPHLPHVAVCGEHHRLKALRRRRDALLLDDLTGVLGWGGVGWGGFREGLGGGLQGFWWP
jgi:hypothetical protein